jgi:hypothetical protein
MTHSSLDYISLVIPRADSLHFLENWSPNFELRV